MVVSLLVALSLVGLYGATLQGLVTEWVSSADSSYGIFLVAVGVMTLTASADRSVALSLASTTRPAHAPTDGHDTSGSATHPS